VRQKAVRWPCGVCGKGVGSNSLHCTSCQKWYRPTRVVPDQRPLNGRCCCCSCSCQKWVHKKCSGNKGSMSKVVKSSIMFKNVRISHSYIIY